MNHKLSDRFKKNTCSYNNFVIFFSNFEFLISIENKKCEDGPFLLHRNKIRFSTFSAKINKQKLSRNEEKFCILHFFFFPRTTLSTSKQTIRLQFRIIFETMRVFFSSVSE